MVKTKIKKPQQTKRNLPCIKSRQFHFPAQPASTSHMLQSYLSSQAGRYHCGCSHIYNCPLTQKKHTSYQSHLIVLLCHMCCTYWAHSGGSCPLGPYSSRVTLQLTGFLRLCPCALHTPSASFNLAICWTQKRKQGWGENWGGGSLAALSCEMFNLSFSFTSSGQVTLIPTLSNLVFSAVSSLLLVTLIQSRFSCLRGLSDHPMC